MFDKHWHVNNEIFTSYQPLKSISMVTLPHRLFFCQIYDTHVYDGLVLHNVSALQRSMGDRYVNTSAEMVLKLQLALYYIVLTNKRWSLLTDRSTCQDDTLWYPLCFNTSLSLTMISCWSYRCNIGRLRLTMLPDADQTYSFEIMNAQSNF